MKKPVKNKKQNCRIKSYHLSNYESYSPEDFESLAEYMRSNNIDYIEIEADAGYNNVDFRAFEIREETDLEAEVRYNKELKEYEKYKVKQESEKRKRKEKLIKEAKKLGLKIEEH